MNGRLFKGIALVVGILLIVIWFKPLFGRISEYYLQKPTVAILAVIGIIAVIYLVVFFKEIFFRGKSK
jgi:membrane protease YdiL (CAAX protease family)